MTRVYYRGYYITKKEYQDILFMAWCLDLISFWTYIENMKLSAVSLWQGVPNINQETEKSKKPFIPKTNIKLIFYLGEECFDELFKAYFNEGNNVWIEEYSTRFCEEMPFIEINIKSYDEYQKLNWRYLTKTKTDFIEWWIDHKDNIDLIIKYVLDKD